MFLVSFGISRRKLKYSSRLRRPVFNILRRQVREAVGFISFGEKRDCGESRQGAAEEQQQRSQEDTDMH